jgi:hypothetical protein
VSRFEIASLDIGVVQDMLGNAKNGVTPTITDSNDDPSRRTRRDRLHDSSVAPTTDALGAIPGYLDPGIYTFEVTTVDGRGTSTPGRRSPTAA